jgi:hypothetical protein
MGSTNNADGGGWIDGYTSTYATGLMLYSAVRVRSRQSTQLPNSTQHVNHLDIAPSIGVCKLALLRSGQIRPPKRSHPYFKNLNGLKK